MCFRLVWGLSLFEVAILLTCALMPGSPFCRGQWLWKSQTCTKKRGWVPWFCREDALLHLWQVPHSVEVWGPKSQVWLYKMGTPNPPPGHFLGDQIILVLQKLEMWNRNCLYKMDFCTFQGFQVRRGDQGSFTSSLYNDSTKWIFVFLMVFFLPSSNSA